MCAAQAGEATSGDYSANQVSVNNHVGAYLFCFYFFVFFCRGNGYVNIHFYHIYFYVLFSACKRLFNIEM